MRLYSCYMNLIIAIFSIKVKAIAMTSPHPLTHYIINELFIYFLTFPIYYNTPYYFHYQLQFFYNLVTFMLAQSEEDFSQHFRWKDFIYGLIFGLTDTWRSKFFCFHSRLKLVDGMCWECELHPHVIISWKTFFTAFLCGFTWCHFQNCWQKSLLEIRLLLSCIIQLGCLLSSMLKWCLLSWQSRNYIKCEF